MRRRRGPGCWKQALTGLLCSHLARVGLLGAVVVAGLTVRPCLLLLLPLSSGGCSVRCLLLVEE